MSSVRHKFSFCICLRRLTVPWAIQNVPHTRVPSLQTPSDNTSLYKTPEWATYLFPTLCTNHLFESGPCLLPPKEVVYGSSTADVSDPSLVASGVRTPLLSSDFECPPLLPPSSVNRVESPVSLSSSPKGTSPASRSPVFSTTAFGYRVRVTSAWWTDQACTDCSSPDHLAGPAPFARFHRLSIRSFHRSDGD